MSRDIEHIVKILNYSKRGLKPQKAISPTLPSMPARSYT